MDPKNFLQALSALVYTIFEGKARAKKTRCFGQNLPKSAENAFFGLFFKFLPAEEKIFAKTGSFYCFGRARKINLVDLKEVQKIFENFLKIRPPRENPKFTPGFDQLTKKLDTLWYLFTSSSFGQPEEEREPKKKRSFLVKTFLKNALEWHFVLLFKNLPSMHKILWQTSVFILFWKSSANQFG